MIRFVASDLDGTLLQNGAQTLEPRMLALVRQLRERGILFAAASGRQYLNLRHLFAPVRGDMLFLAENGALVMHGDRVIHKTPLPWELGVDLMKDIYSYPHCDVMLNGQYTCYIMPKRQQFSDHLLYTVKNTVTIVDDIFAVREDFFKISAYVYDRKTAEMAKYFQSKWADHFSVAVSGNEWVDFTLASKGASLRMLQDLFGLERDEMMAFGDNYNDESMLRLVGHGYAMENAAEEIKAMCANRCERVEDVLEQLLLAQRERVPDALRIK